MKVMRLILASEVTYVLNVLSEAVGNQFDDRRVVDIPLRTEMQVKSAKWLEKKFIEDNFSTVLRNGSNAITVYGVSVIDL